MGLYDMYEKNEVQIKAGNCSMNQYNVEDNCCDLDDGVYLAYEGIVVIKNNKVFSIFDSDQLFDKWGVPLPTKKLLTANIGLTI